MGIMVRQPARWLPSDWSFFPDEVLNTQQGNQQYVRGIQGTNTFAVTGVGSNEAHRVFYMTRERATNSEMVSRWGPHSAFTNSAPQVGHLHRMRRDASGIWTGIGVWQNIFGNTYSTVIVKAIRTDGVTLTQGNLGGSFLAAAGINRTIRVLGAVNVAGFNVRQYFCTPADLQGMVNGDLVTVSQMDDTNFNVPVALPVSNVDIAAGTFGVTGTGDNTKDEAALGAVTFADTGKAANWGYVVRSRVEGNRVRVKQWRFGTQEPDAWHIDTDLGLDTTVLEPARAATTDGFNGLWYGHVHSNTVARISGVEVVRLS